MKSSDLESAARSYAYLRGALSIPAGLLFVLAALGNWEVGPFSHPAVFIAGVLATGAAYGLIARYYQEHYGRISPSPGQQVRSAATVALAIAVVLGGSLLLRSNFDWSLDLPVNPIAVSFAVVMLASYAIGGALRGHHVVVWGGLFAVGALPVWTGADPSNIGLVLCGAALAVCGAFDHLAFVRTFGPRELPATGTGRA